MLFKDYMGGGISGGMAKAIGGSIATAVSAAGTVIGDATALTASKNIVTTVATGAGVKLYAMNTGESQIVYNATTTPVKVYPGQSTIGINQTTAGTSVYIPGYSTCEFHAVTTTLVLANLSA